MAPAGIRLLALIAGCMALTSLCACDAEQEDTIEVVRYVGPEIQPTSDMTPWKVSVDENRVVTLEEDTTAVACPPHGCDSVWHLLFLDTGAPLPEFISLTASSSTNTSVLVSGTVYIQDWDLGDVLSGEIKGTMHPGVVDLQPDRLVWFWVDLGQEQE